MNFGGDFGASQFAGGGFVPSPAPGGDTGYGGQQKFGAGANKQTVQTVREVTVRQLLRDNAMDASDDQAKVDGVDLAMFHIVGRIVSRHDSSAYLKLKIDDGTGIIDVIYYPDDHNDLMNSVCHGWTPNTYVRAVGNLRALDQKKSMVAFRIKAITDFNEITYHNLQCIFQHCHFTKGVAPPGAAPQQHGGFASTGPSAPSGGFGAAPGGGGFGAPAGAKSGEDKMRQDILQVYNGCTAEYGLEWHEAMSLLQQQGLHYSEAQVRSAVEFLANEGNLYSTTDENHYKSCQ